MEGESLADLCVYGLIFSHKRKEHQLLDLLGKVFFYYPNCPNLVTNTLLVQAVNIGCISSTRYLFNAPNVINKPDPNFKNNLALEIAVQQSYSLIAEVLLENGANVGARNFLSNAAYRGDIEMVKTLTESDTNIIHKDNDYALRRSVAAGQAEVVKFLLEKGASVSLNTFTLAAINGHLDIIKVLLPHNPPDPPNISYTSLALYNAAVKGFTEIVEELVKNGITQHTLNEEKLEKIARDGHKKILTLLNREDVWGKVQSQSNQSIMRILVRSSMKAAITSLILYFLFLAYFNRPLA
mmetsp:Transcript_14441/g.18155  ORF Transcript_14441/g.18155 Transcript_14441/m.18155 type:complete len:296 (-) Transcript_14441:214-1101(-)